MITMYDLESYPKYDEVNGVSISELQAFASVYGINHVYSIRFPNQYQFYQGQIWKLKDMYVVYLNHNLPRQCVARNQRLEEEYPEIIECLEILLTTDRKAAYFVLLHETGHKELGHPIRDLKEPGMIEQPIPLLDIRLPHRYNKLEEDIKKWKRQFYNIFEERDADNWAIAEFKKLKMECML